MESGFSISFEIEKVIADCLTNQSVPDISNLTIDGSIYDPNIHGEIYKIPVPVRHLLIARYRRQMFIEKTCDEMNEIKPHTTEWECLNKLEKVMEYHIDIISDLEVRLLGEPLVAKGFDVSELELVLLNDWKFTYAKADVLPGYSESSSVASRSIKNRTLH